MKGFKLQKFLHISVKSCVALIQVETPSITIILFFNNIDLIQSLWILIKTGYSKNDVSVSLLKNRESFFLLNLYSKVICSINSKVLGLFRVI
jgi:hypothetical protein